MRLMDAFVIAFSTYSRIPMPRAEWSEESRRYAMCFFPLVGAAVGLLLWGWLALCDALEQLGAVVRVQTAIEMRQIAEPYIRNKAIRHFEKGRIVIFGCGTGSPFFSTDTAAALRSVEINADALLKATNVDGVYDKDPNRFTDAVKYDDVTFQEVITRDLKVMDSTAFSLCKDNDMPIIVFNLNDPDNILRVVKGEKIGTTVKN